MAMATKVMADGANPPKRNMPTFLAKMMQANQNVICTAKGEDVRKADVEYLLQQRMRIPIFQRRYCWGEDQWATLFDDVALVASGTKERHSLGRITCAVGDSDDGRLLVIDGQQRNTTAILLLAAIRDVASARLGDDDCAALSLTIDRILFSSGLEEWIAARERNTHLEDGAALDFAALVPTYCDRASFFAATLPPRAEVLPGSGSWRRPMEGKQYFLQRIQGESTEHLVAVCDVVLHKLQWLFFPISLNDGHEDGTENLQVIFERLALRDATFCKPHRATEYANMGAADFVRNLLLGSFEQECEAIRMYKTHWLPIEQGAAASADLKRSSGVAEILEGMLDSFLNAQPEHMQKSCVAASTSKGIGGELYARFRKWLIAALAEGDPTGAPPHSSDVERKTEELLTRLKDFALTHFARPVAPGAAGRAGPGPQARIPLLGKASGDAWRCPRCHWKNPASSTACTTCCHSKPQPAP